jgi:hypothetical protein
MLNLKFGIKKFISVPKEIAFSEMHRNSFNFND